MFDLGGLFKKDNRGVYTDLIAPFCVEMKAADFVDFKVITLYAKILRRCYAKSSGLSDEQAAVLRRYYDFLIRYLNLFYDPELQNVSLTHMGWDNYEYQCLSHPVSVWGEAGKLWLILREKPERKCLFSVNLCGCEDDFWNKGKQEFMSGSW